MILNQRIELVDDTRLINQLVGLERRTKSGGRNLATHFPGTHDDLANAAARALVLAAGSLKEHETERIKED